LLFGKSKEALFFWMLASASFGLIPSRELLFKANFSNALFLGDKFLDAIIFYPEWLAVLSVSAITPFCLLFGALKCVL
jgi:hypothetical protein